MKKWIDLLKLLFRAGKYRFVQDRPEFRFMMQKIRKGAVVIDIGAHKGGYSFWMKEAIGKEGKLIAFEPQEKGYLILKDLFKQSNVTLENMAVSDTEETRTLYIQPQQNIVSYEASLENKYEDPDQAFVRTTTIDRYCSKHNIIPGFIKIDVEGHELQVIQGARDTLTTHHPGLLVEAEARHIGEEKLSALFKLLQ
ncbi:MAG: FkbM family methyltransferase, partial [Flavisolibacter sp.]|nr:FkbM family methyltransferase [Flavisolibacter sp.]